MSDLGSLGSLHARIQEFSSGGWGGGGPGQSDKKSSDNVFLVLSLFYRSQMVNFKVIYHFSRFQRGSNISQGGGGSNCFFPIETHITCDFPGGPGLSPPPGSALALVCFLWNNAPPDPGYGVNRSSQNSYSQTPPPPADLRIGSIG